MDRAWRGAAALGLTITAVVVVAGGALALADSTLRVERWLAPDADLARVLGQVPTECLTHASDPETTYRIEVGRAAFRSPLLLGGQAARAGLTCESCHREGRSNPDFQFPGVSGPPGTADVTSSLFSSHRGDDLNNPRPIPDLSGPAAGLKVSRETDARALQGFVHGLITEEFDGAEPPPQVLDGLVAYIRALSPEACPASPTRALRVGDLIEDARRAVGAGLEASARGDTPTAVAMAQAARGRLGLIFERYEQPGLAAERAALSKADADLALVLVSLRRNDPRAATSMRVWLLRSERLGQRLAESESRSLFDPLRLATLARPRPRPAVAVK